MKTSLLVLANLCVANAGWGFLSCDTVQSQTSVDFAKFDGTWYEIYRDNEHIFWSGDKCTVSKYAYQTTAGSGNMRSMILSQTSEKVLFGGSNIETSILTFPTGDGFGIENFSWLFRDGTHQILATDYYNYALMYGCVDVFYGIFGHFTWASMLSRTKLADSNGVLVSKKKLTSISYPWSASWAKAGLDCGFDALPTNDEIFIKKLETKPDFLSYSYSDPYTVYARYFFETANGHLPNGYLTGPLTYKLQKNIKTNLKTMIQASEFQVSYTLPRMRYDAASVYDYDVELLTVGLASSVQTTLASVVSTKKTCCFKDYEQYMNGYARVIVSGKTTHKIYQYFEGEFKNGKLANFGRFLDNKVTKAVMISYTGWWPTSATGKGIAVLTDQFTVYQGTFNKDSNFPLTGLDSLSRSSTITSLQYR